MARMRGREWAEWRQAIRQRLRWCSTCRQVHPVDAGHDLNCVRRARQPELPIGSDTTTAPGAAREQESA